MKIKKFFLLSSCPLDTVYVKMSAMENQYFLDIPKTPLVNQKNLLSIFFFIFQIAEFEKVVYSTTQN